MKKRCNFCKQLKELIKAHIFPKAILRYIMQQYDSRTPVEVTKNSNISKSVRNDGYFDSDILCEDCDHLFGTHEEKLISFLKNSQEGNYNYKSISIAILEIFWKACITSIQTLSMYPKKHANKLYDTLKKVLNDSDIISLKDFPIWIKRYKNGFLTNHNNKNDLLLNNIMPGSKTIDMRYGTLYRFDLIGHQIIIGVAGNPLHPSINKFIMEGEANITEIHYYFDVTKENVINLSVILALNNFEIN